MWNSTQPNQKLCRSPQINFYRPHMGSSPSVGIISREMYICTEKIYNLAKIRGKKETKNDFSFVFILLRTIYWCSYDVWRLNRLAYMYRKFGKFHVICSLILFIEHKLCWMLTRISNGKFGWCKKYSELHSIRFTRVAWYQCKWFLTVDSKM